MGNQSKVNPFGRDTIINLPPLVRDRMGRALNEGDILVLDAKAPYFVVTKIAPCMDPSAPPNLLDVTVQCRMLFRSMRGDIAQEFTRVMTAEEARPKDAEETDEKKPAGLSLVTPQGDPV